MELILQAIQKNIIEKYINESKIRVVEFFDYKIKKIKYSPQINSSREIKTLTGDEEIVRAYLLTKLVNEFGYSMDKIFLEYEYKAGRPHTITSRIDIKVNDLNDNCFLFIEVKSPKDYENLSIDETIEEQLYKLSAMEEYEGRKIKYLMLYSIEFVNGVINDKVIIIDKTKFSKFNDWKEKRDFTDEIPSHYGKSQKAPYIKGSKKDLEINFTHEMLNKLQMDLHNVLWGGGGTNDNDIFSSLTNIILAKIKDEDEKNNGEIYDFQSLVFDNDENEFESNEKLFNRINALYRRALKDRLNIIDNNEINKLYVVDTQKFSLTKLKYTVQALEKYSFVDGKNSISGKDILGDFFEGIIRNGFKQSKGQFFTHINIVRFMLWAIKADKLAISKINNIAELPYFIDCSAGSGTFLIEYMKFITQNIKYRFKDQLDTSRKVQDKMQDWFEPDNRENRWAREYIYGTELNFDLGTATKVNMILHGDGSSNIFVGSQKGDGLLSFDKYIKFSAPNALNQKVENKVYSKKLNEQFDLILTNPPFSVDLDKDTKKYISNNFEFGEKANSENFFIERYYQLLKEKGRLGVVLPESVFDGTSNKYIRLFLFKYFDIKAVISLPQIAFGPYTNTKTSILFAQKKSVIKIKEWNNIWNKYSSIYQNLKCKVENIISVFDNKSKKEKLSSIKNLTSEEEKQILIEFLGKYISSRDVELTSSELIKKYRDEIKKICLYDKDTLKMFGYVNPWWVFSRVSLDLDSLIFMAEVEKIGYKRTTNKEKSTINELYRTNEVGEILVDDSIKETVLDYIREINWEDE